MNTRRNVVDIVYITAHEVYAVERPLSYKKLKDVFPRGVKAPIQ